MLLTRLLRLRTSVAKPSRGAASRPRLEPLEDRALPAAVWPSYAGNAQHTAVAPVPAQPLQGVRWQVLVDQARVYSGNSLLEHMGTALADEAGLMFIPVKTTAAGDFQVQARHGADGSLVWVQTTDYVQPPHDWGLPYQPVLTPNNRLFFAGAGGTLYYMDNIDSPTPSAPVRVAFYGLANYQANPAAYNAAVFIDTPLTSDGDGNIFFGFHVTGSTPLGLQSGLARLHIDPATGVATGTSVTAVAAAADPAITKVTYSCAPALSNDGSTVYVTVNTGNGTGISSTGYLVQLNSTTLAPVARVRLKDPFTGNDAYLPDVGTASPLVAPDGTVYLGVLGNPPLANHFRGALRRFAGDLSTAFPAGAFGWDDTVSVVDGSAVSGYTAATYLLFTKFNDYAGAGGSGINRIAILDPNATETDPVTGAPVMKVVASVASPTGDEWCINTAVVAGRKVYAGCEDGKLYCWDLATNSITEVVTLTSGRGEAYTPTSLGADGTVYAINDGILFAVGRLPDLNWAGGGLSGLPATADTATPFTITRSYNVSGASAPGAVTLGYYASSDTTIGNGDDISIGQETLSALAAKAVGLHSGTSPALRIGRPGTQYVYAVLDSGNTAPETDETNNVFLAGQAVSVTGAVDIVVDNGDPGYAEVGPGWFSSVGGVYNGSARAHAAGSGADTATWQVTGLSAGYYQVQADWKGYSDQAPDATYKIYDGSTLVATVSADQTRDAAGPMVNGVAFQALATVNVTSGTLRVVLSDAASNYVIADSVRTVSWPPIALAQGPQVNGNSAALAGAQRSLVDSIVYTFNHAVALATGAFTIALHANVTVNGAGGQTVGTLPTLNYSSSDGGITWVVTFSGAGVVNGSIADGVYDLTLNHAAVTDAQGQTLAADRTDTFFRLYGDANGDGTVNNADNFQFKNTFLKNAGDPGYLAYFDYGGDGTVNNSDNFQFKKRFLTAYAGFIPTI